MKYIVFFRGINVGGKNMVKMAGLRAMLEGLGLQAVRTYIQSGNTLFESDEHEDALKEKIERGFRVIFGFDCSVTLRTARELAEICGGVPFSPEEITEAETAASGAESLHCYLLSAPVPIEAVKSMNTAYGGSDRLAARNREIYLLCYQSIRDSKLAVSLGKLGLPMTARYLKTLRKLREMTNE